MKVELEYTVEKSNQEVGEVECQEDCWAYVWSNFIHNLLYPCLSFEVFIRAVKVVLFDRLSCNYEVNQRVSYKPDEINLNRVVQHHL